jgi:hypothetical protein
VIDVWNLGNRRRHGLVHSADWRAGASTASFSDGTQHCDAVKALMLQADEPHPVAVRQPLKSVAKYTADWSARGKMAHDHFPMLG